LETEDFYSNPEKVTSQYYDEMRDLFKKMTGCTHVHMFHHQVRNKDRVVSGQSKDGWNTSTPVQPYAVNAIHSDSSAFHAEEMFKSMVRSAPETCRSGRFLYINAWRNIGEDPIEDNHLAVLDERTLVKPDDYIQTHLHGVGYDVLQYNLSSRNARQHKWYYFPQMAKDEVLIFKQWDSDPLQAGRLCFHTAINDPTAPDGAVSRQSIEARAFLFFPDHTPNTCPLMPALQTKSVDGKCDEAKAQEGAQKLHSALAYIETNDSIRAMVVGYLRGQYMAEGAKVVLELMAKDEQGHHGLTDASAETQARVVELLLEQNAGMAVDRIFAGPSATRILLGKFCAGRIGAAVLGGAVVLFVQALLRVVRR